MFEEPKLVNSRIEKELSIKNDGRMASLVQSQLHGILEEIKADVLTEMSMDFRKHDHDHAKMLANQARLCTLEDIENRLVQKIHKSERLSGKDKE